MTNKFNFSRRSFLRAIGAVTLGLTAGSVVTPRFIAGAANDFTTEAQSAIDITLSHEKFHSSLRQLEAQGLPPFDLSRLTYKGEHSAAQAQGVQGIRVVNLMSTLGIGI